MNKKNKFIIEQNLFNGNWQEGSSDQSYDVLNPFNQEIIAKVQCVNQKDVTECISCAEKGFDAWSQVAVNERSRILSEWAKLLKANSNEIATIITLESGKPLKESHGEIIYSADYLEWFASESLRIYGDTIVNDSQSKIIITKEPVGVCACITPWNFPMAMLARKVAPALAAGCSMIVKPSELTPLSAFAFARLGHDAGLPMDVLSVIVGDASMIGQLFSKSDVIRKLSFTGSTPVGQILYQQSGETLKRLSMELGGNAPMIVLDDADIEHAVKQGIIAKFRNAGQTCVCVNRFYIHEKVFDTFVKKFISLLKNEEVGDGMDPKTTIGPLINQSGLDKVVRLVDNAKEQGARVLCGGKISDLSKSCYEPTVIVGVSPDTQIIQEEIFGPVAVCIPFREDKDVIKKANDTKAGLASYLFGRDFARLERISAALAYGMVGINTGMISNAKCPFGGVKYSGFGREGSKYGLEEYLNIKYCNWYLN